MDILKEINIWRNSETFKKLPVDTYLVLKPKKLPNYYQYYRACAIGKIT